jgi:hypothetical protein
VTGACGPWQAINEGASGLIGGLIGAGATMQGLGDDQLVLETSK